VGGRILLRPRVATYRGRPPMWSVWAWEMKRRSRETASGGQRAAADVEGEVEGGERDAGLVPRDRDALHGVALDLEPPHRPRPRGGGG